MESNNIMNEIVGGGTPHNILMAVSIIGLIFAIWFWALLSDSVQRSTDKCDQKYYTRLSRGTLGSFNLGVIVIALTTAGILAFSK